MSDPHNPLSGPDTTDEPPVLLPPGFLRDPVHLLAFGFGSGAASRAPGTWGSVAAIPFWLLICWLPAWGYWAVVALAFVVGIWLCGRTADDLKVHDHGGIVWDEFVGMWIALGLIPQSLTGVLLGFLLFRFFDVLKPWPINWFDRRLPGGLGIMFDDVIAGAMALGVLALVDAWLFPLWS